MSWDFFLGSLFTLASICVIAEIFYGKGGEE